MKQNRNFFDFFTLFPKTNEFQEMKTYLIHLLQIVESMTKEYDLVITSSGYIKILFYMEDGVAEHIDIEPPHLLTYLDRLLKLQATADYLGQTFERDEIYKCFSID